MWINTIDADTMLVTVVNGKNDTVSLATWNFTFWEGRMFTYEGYCKHLIEFAQVLYKIMNIPSIIISSK